MSDNVLVEKWGEIVDLEDKKVAPVENREVMAQILENQEHYNLTEGNQVADIAQYTPILIPAVRRIMPGLLANKLVGIQALNQPTGHIYALRYTYGADSSVDGVDKGVLGRAAQANSLFNTAAFILDVAFAGVAGDTVTIAGAAGTVKHVEGNKILVKFANATAAAGAKAASGFDTYNIAHAMNNEAGYNLIFSNFTGPMTTAQGEVLGGEGQTQYAEMKMHLERASIEVQTRALKANYSVELAQDLKNVHGLNAEEELINIMEYEVSAQLDRELVSAINAKATVVPAWSYGAVGGPTGSADGRWELEKFRTLYTRIIREANQIALTTRRGTGNIIIASTNVITALEMLPNFQYAPVGGTLKQQSGVAEVGTLDGRYAVYLDTFAMHDYVTVAYKGSSAFDSGLMYCPYVPLQIVKVQDPKTLQPIIALKTRDAICSNLQGTANYYRTFSVDLTGSSLGGGNSFGINTY